MILNKFTLLGYQLRNISSIRSFATNRLTRYLNDKVRENILYGNILKRYNSKCGNNGKKGNGKDGKGGGKEDNLTAVLYGVEDMKLEQRPIPKIADDEVLLKMDCVGICGSDVHYLVHGRIGDFIVKEPMVIGHEASGVVHEIGKKVKTLAKGDRVAIEPGVPCRYCDYCRRGVYNLCPDMRFCATPPIDGNLTRYYKHAADFCFKLPDHVTMEEGALLEPLAVGVQSCKRAGVRVGSKVLIIGAGPIGLVTLMVAQAMGAEQVFIIDVQQYRLDVAQKLCATHTLCVGEKEKPDDIVKKILETMCSQADQTIDCVGTESTARIGIFCTRSGGACVIVGMSAAEIKIPLMNALVRQVDLRGIFRYCNDYPAALSLVASHKVDPKILITHHFDITETAKAFDTARHNTGNPIKVMIHAQPRDANNKKS